MLGRVLSRLMVGAALSVLLCPSEANASAILQTSARAYAGAFSGLPIVTDLDILNNATFLSIVSSDATLSASFGAASFTGTASARAEFGELGAGVTVSIDNYQARNFSQPCPNNPALSCTTDPVGATAFFVDTLTITGGVGSDVLQLTIDVDGTRSVTSSGISSGPSAQGILGVGSTLGSFSFLSVGFNTGGRFTTQAIPFTYGTPFQIAVRLDALVIMSDFNPAQIAGTYDMVATADYLNTAVLSDFRIFTDATRTIEVTNFEVAAESGTAYRVVPEPATLTLFVTGACALVARRRRERYQKTRRHAGR